MLNPNCFIKLTIESADFLTDADTFGKQDPFVKVMCAGIEYKTKIIDEGGKNVVFDETFELKNIAQEIDNNGKLVLATYDLDGITDDFLGDSAAIDFKELINSDDEITHRNINLDQNGKSNGTITFKT
jgi:Ca2+-dependent lipid-binding protein